jgi:hypothetical protein
MRDRVTINLFSVETEEPPGYTLVFRSQIENIKKIYTGLVNAANQTRRTPPEFIVSILLIPNWDRMNNSYNDDLYLRSKNRFVDEIRNHLLGVNGLIVEDFYFKSVMLSEERAYMHNNKAKGINADMIKTIAIINNASRCRHLQIDSNTVVPSFNDLYLKTFNAIVQKDGVNASYYDLDYVSAHNKMVYTTPQGLIAQSQLKALFWEWCRDHKDDNNIDGDKQKDNNSIYSKVFTEALLQIDYVKKIQLENGKTVYPATLNDTVYWLTCCMITAVNKSWGSNESGIQHDFLQLPMIDVGPSGKFDYQCLFNIIKKYIGNLRVHSKALGLVDSSRTGEASRELLLKVSNCEFELNAAKNFIISAIESRPAIIDNICNLFPNTKNVNNLSNKLFNCSVHELRSTMNSLLAEKNTVKLSR